MKFTPFYNPATAAFTSMTPSNLKCFYDDFIINIPYCLDELIQIVWRTPGFEVWNADFSPESLGGLGEWVATKVYKRGDSLAGDSRSSPLQQSSIVVCLSEAEQALAVKVGMYYGEVAVRNNPALSWFQLKGSKKLADYGQPVIAGKNGVLKNPVRVANVFLCCVADGSKNGSRLRETYDYWMKGTG